MSQIAEITPVQHRTGTVATLFKRFLHTKIGAKLAFYAGVRGFNRIVAEHHKFLRYTRNGETLGRDEFIKMIEGTARLGVYRKVRLNVGFNSRVNKGADLVASLITGAAQNSISSPLPPKYIALSTSSLTADKTDTTLTGETVVAGLARALGTQGSYTGPSTLDGAASYTVTKTFTLTGSATTIVSAALFDAASTGNLFVEANLSSSAAMGTNDTLAITWTVNL